MDYCDEVIEIKDNSSVDSLEEESELREQKGHNSNSFVRLQAAELLTKPDIKSINETLKSNPIMDKIKTQHKSESFHSDSDSSESAATEDNRNSVINEFDLKQLDGLDVPADVKELFQYISRYAPQKIDIEYHLQPFIPEFIPAVGDIDAFLKVIPPPDFPDQKPQTREFIQNLGFEILDEPCGQQSDPALLHMKLRTVSMQPRAMDQPIPIAKNANDIDKWIQEIQMLHVNQSFPSVVKDKQVDIDVLMQEWPVEMERVLSQLGLPEPTLDCSLEFYIKLMATIFDIPLEPNSKGSNILACYMLFNLYSAIKSSVK